MASSVSERNLLNVIKSHYPDVIAQKRFSWLGNQSLDIYIPSKKVAIEYQGEQHYRPVHIYGGKRGYREQKVLDKKKIRLCKENGVELYYFTFADNAPNILHRKKMYKDTRVLLRKIKYSWFKWLKYISYILFWVVVLFYLFLLLI